MLREGGKRPRSFGVDIDGDPGVEIEMHIFVDSKAPWDHIGGNAKQHSEHAMGKQSSDA